MSKFTLSVSFDDADELAALVAKLQGASQVIETKVDCVQQPVVETPVEEVKRRGRPAKKIEEVQQVEVKVEQPVAQQEPIDEFVDLEDKPEVTKQMVSDALMAYGKKFGRKAMDELLAKFDAPTFQKLSIDRYADVVMAAKAAVDRGSI